MRDMNLVYIDHCSFLIWGDVPKMVLKLTKTIFSPGGFRLLISNLALA